MGKRYLANGLILVSRNINDFKNIPDLEVVNPYDIQAVYAVAKAIILLATFELPQAAAGTQTDVRYLLAELFNDLLRDVIPAQAGISDNPGGVNGYFKFRVTPKRNVIR